MTEGSDSLPGAVFDGVEAEVRDGLLAAGQLVEAAEGTLLISEGEPASGFFVLQHGSVRVYYQSETGSQLTCKIFGAPAVFGEMECLIGLEYLESVVALERTEVLKIPAPAFLAALDASPRLTRNLLEDVVRRLAVAADHERALAFHPVDTRLATLLLTYVREYGVPVADGTKIRVPLSHENLSLSLGVARKSVTRAMKGWRQEGILRKEGELLVVTDVDALRARGDSSLMPLAHRSGS